MNDIPAVPPIEWFQDPGLDELTPLTVTADGRVFGHLCGWGTKHRGLSGNIVPPRSRINYGEFMLGDADVIDDGVQRSITVGNLTMGIGHAPMSYSLRQASEHYDNADAIVAQVAVGEDQHGAWFAGSMLPDVDQFRRRRFRSCGGLSGDWRVHESGGLELCAALAVPVPGFPVPRARVASGAPQALVAAGAIMRSPTASFAKRVDPTWAADAVSLSDQVGAMWGKAKAWKYTGDDGRVVGLQRAVTPADLAEQIAASLHRRQQDDALNAAHAELIGELDDTPDRYAALMAEVDDTPDRAAALLAELAVGDVDPKGLTADEIQALASLAAEEGITEEAFLSRMPPQLRESYLHGKAAAKIAWGTPGDFARCEAEAKHHGIPARMRPGMCSDLHVAATGSRPGRH